MSNNYILAMFDDEEDLVRAAKQIVSHEVLIHDIYTPFPVHGLDDLLLIKRSRLPYITFLAGLFGLLMAIAFQVWSSASAWPIIVGGKPHNSFPAFMPVTFELMVLFAALVTVGMFFFRAKLFPGKQVDLIDPRVTDNKFMMVINKCSAVTKKEEFIQELLTQNGASEITEREI
ncbi:MAG: DUF3341 domain-containing protein [Bdellovibrionales bacterium]|jgi:hypothetical protein|nr:DUF3341 domain-containing protein [Bdellovibrionales bacterium]MBT3527053.1 DUF3341 domain-containing protein [Bdellovibrionales bacterium]MBT7668819.1 DUF3341 domain-containing protein [Bdellovibrionales bacterium]MBT7765590.1 DUF3341 domain-containing protein [Bdellovibrionales bacterium]